MPSVAQNEGWLSLSEEFANAIQSLHQSIVAVHGGGRLSSSGICWRPGLIVTASHAMRREHELSITLPDGSSIPAALVGRDPSTDVAVVRVQETVPLSPVQATSAADLEVGQLVIAVGRSHLGDLAASSGIVARLGGSWRTWKGGKIDHLVRPDITLYPGQSGSALINAAGKVLGMNTGELARMAAITVPTATINRVIDELLRHGHVRRPYLGVAMQTVALADEVRQKGKVESVTGLLLVHVEADGPASKAGLLVGDIIVGIGNAPTADLTAMQDALIACEPGKEATLAILRGGEKRRVNVIIADRPARK